MASIYARQNLQNGGDDQGEFVDDRENSFWWTRKGETIRWSIFFGILFLFFAYMAIGHWHAKRRIKKGLTPLAYHRWLLNREQRARYDPNYQNPSVYYNQYPQGGQYGLQNMPPPPVYDPNSAMPPTYQPPAGATKVDPSQWRSEPTRRPAESGEAAPSYDAPPGPPAVQANYTGGSIATNNPHRL